MMAMDACFRRTSILKGLFPSAPGWPDSGRAYLGSAAAGITTLKEGVSLFGITCLYLAICAEKMELAVCARQLGFFPYVGGMKVLPQTGTAKLLEKLSPHLDDVFINGLLPRPSGPGRRRKFCSAQLFRVLLLSLLTPARSFNLLVKLLPENRTWRQFALLPNQREIPDAKMLHQFRGRLDLWRLRQLNAQLLQPLLDQLDPSRKTLAIMDATDLPASTNSFKKTKPIILPDMPPLAPAR